MIDEARLDGERMDEKGWMGKAHNELKKIGLCSSSSQSCLLPTTHSVRLFLVVVVVSVIPPSMAQALFER
jgi:hypothetical protein